MTRRFRVASDVSVSDVSSHLCSQGYHVSVPEKVSMTRVWWDTHDGIFNARSYQCFYSALDQYWYVAHELTDDVCAKTRGDAHTVPESGAVSDLISPLTDLTNLHPIVAGSGVRHTLHCTNPQGENIQVWYETWHFSDPLQESMRATESYCVWHLTEGDNTGEEVCARMAEALDGVACAAALCECACAALGYLMPGSVRKEEWHITADDSAHIAVRKIFSLQQEIIRENIRGARVDAHPEYVHELRIVLRRLRCAVMLMKKYIDVAERRALREEIRALGKTLGRVRDYDVSLSWLRCLELPPSFMTLYEKRMQMSRAHAQSALCVALQDSACHELLSHISCCADAVVAAIAPTATAEMLAEASAQLQRRILKRWQKGRFSSLTYDALHTARKDFRRVRYSCEYFVNIYGKDGARVVHAAKKMQNRLGALSDARVRHAHISRLIEESAAVEDTPPHFFVTCGKLLAYQEAEIHTRHMKCKKAWKKWLPLCVLTAK